MNALVLLASPFDNGHTARVVEAFASGAKSNGANVEIINVTKKNISPVSFEYLQNLEKGEDLSDDAPEILDKIAKADIVVFATPLYYFGMTAQLKALIDRFCAVRENYLVLKKKTILISTCGSEAPWVFDALKAHYESILRYLNWEDLAQVCFHPSQLVDVKLSEVKALGEKLSKL